MAVATVESRANEAIAKLHDVQRREAKALEKVKALEKELQGFKGDLEAVGKNIEKDLAVELSMAPEKVQVTIVQYKESPGLEVEEDPYATLLEDDHVPMEVEVPFDDSIEMIARNTLGDRRRKTVRLATRNVGDCQITGVRS
ncbi:hypothetical protein BHE74_00051754 [Ensete ventricosum]|nr:hypothetical protein BHE74_00051754 [Ensete ventricosum]RZS11199.1 hypothetical protein BHM03_00042507 [Ensete ventricosum]